MDRQTTMSGRGITVATIDGETVGSAQDWARNDVAKGWRWTAGSKKLGIPYETGDGPYGLTREEAERAMLSYLNKALGYGG